MKRKSSKHWIVCEPIPARTPDGHQMKFKTLDGAINTAKRHFEKKVCVYELCRIVVRKDSDLHIVNAAKVIKC